MKELLWVLYNVFFPLVIPAIFLLVVVVIKPGIRFREVKLRTYFPASGQVFFGIGMIVSGLAVLDDASSSGLIDTMGIVLVCAYAIIFVLDAEAFLDDAMPEDERERQAFSSFVFTSCVTVGLLLGVLALVQELAK